MYSNRNKILISLGVIAVIGFLITILVIVNKPSSKSNLVDGIDTDKIYDELLSQPEVEDETPAIVESKEEIKKYKRVNLDNLGVSLKIPETEYIDNQLHELETTIDDCYVLIYKIEKPENMNYDKESILELLGISDEELYNSRDSLQEVYRERYFSNTDPKKWESTTIINNERVNIKDIVTDDKIKDYERDNVDINDAHISFDGSMDYTKTNIKNSEEDGVVEEQELKDSQLNNTTENIESNEQEIIEDNQQENQNNITINLSDPIDSGDRKYVYNISYIESIMDDTGAYILSKDGQLAILDSGDYIIIAKVLSDNGSNVSNIDNLIDSVKLIV